MKKYQIILPAVAAFYLAAGLLAGMELNTRLSSRESRPDPIEQETDYQIDLVTGVAAEGDLIYSDLGELADQETAETAAEAVTETETAEPERVIIEGVDVTDRHFYLLQTTNRITILRLREAPNLLATILYKMPPGTPGYVVYRGKNWSYIAAETKDGVKIGYAFNGYLAFEEIPPEEVPVDYLKIEVPELVEEGTEMPEGFDENGQRIEDVSANDVSGNSAEAASQDTVSDDADGSGTGSTDDSAAAGSAATAGTGSSVTTGSAATGSSQAPAAQGAAQSSMQDQKSAAAAGGSTGTRTTVAAATGSSIGTRTTAAAVTGRSTGTRTSAGSQESAAQGVQTESRTVAKAYTAAEATPGNTVQNVQPAVTTEPGEAPSRSMIQRMTDQIAAKIQKLRGFLNGEQDDNKENTGVYVQAAYSTEDIRGRFRFKNDISGNSIEIVKDPDAQVGDLTGYDVSGNTTKILYEDISGNSMNDYQRRNDHLTSPPLRP
ncbi:MAG: hypothetical protein II800_00030 [Lachnospiraceae bacterium]|nr:hypothetical protein [Lachnospiraceae bacterium]